MGSKPCEKQIGGRFGSDNPCKTGENTYEKLIVQLTAYRGLLQKLNVADVIFYRVAKSELPNVCIYSDRTDCRWFPSFRCVEGF